MVASPPDEAMIFNSARRLGRDARVQFLRDACGGDPALIRRIEALLAVNDAPDDLLDRPAVQTPACDETRTGPPAQAVDPLDFLAPSDRPGAIGRLGHHDVHEVIGRGGMGIVLKAFDRKLERVVAIKVMAPGRSKARVRIPRQNRASGASPS